MPLTAAGLPGGATGCRKTHLQHLQDHPRSDVTELRSVHSTIGRFSAIGLAQRSRRLTLPFPLLARNLRIALASRARRIGRLLGQALLPRIRPNEVIRHAARCRGISATTRSSQLVQAPCYAEFTLLRSAYPALLSRFYAQSNTSKHCRADRRGVGHTRASARGRRDRRSRMGVGLVIVLAAFEAARRVSRAPRSWS